MPWSINGTSVGELTEEVRTWNDLTLTFRVPKADIDSPFRTLDQSTGKFELIEKPDGSFVVRDRSNGDNVHTLTPPSERSTLRQINEYVVDEYEEEMKDHRADVYTVRITFVATSSKSGGNALGTPSRDSTSEWLFSFADGGVATARVESELRRGGNIVEGSVNVTLIVERAELRKVEESVNRQASVYTRNVPDGSDVIEDLNANNRNTVTVDAPSNRDPDNDILTPGDYVVEEWESRLINNEFYELSMQMTPLF